MFLFFLNQHGVTYGVIPILHHSCALNCTGRTRTKTGKRHGARLIYRIFKEMPEMRFGLRPRVRKHKKQAKKLISIGACPTAHILLTLNLVDTHLIDIGSAEKSIGLVTRMSMIYRTNKY